MTREVNLLDSLRETIATMSSLADAPVAQLASGPQFDTWRITMDLVNRTLIREIDRVVDQYVVVTADTSPRYVWQQSVLLAALCLVLWSIG